MEHLTIEELVEKLRQLRMHLAPIATVEHLDLLAEAERRLKSTPTSRQKPRSKKRLTKEERLNRWLSKL